MTPPSIAAKARSAAPSASDIADLSTLDAVALSRLLRTGAVSAREATQAALDRMAKVNPRINAVIDVMADEALAAADTADKKRVAGEELGALHGLPVTIKDCVDVKGHAMTNGVVAFAGNIAREDHSVVANWRKAGAIVIGRTNTPAFSWRWFTNNDLHGATKNPRNPRLTPGGSTGGGAAAVAAGIGTLAHGTDYGGSVRYPAYACGVVGLRPGMGRVPSFDPSGPPPALPSLFFSVNGVLARTVGDTRLGFNAMAQADTRDPWWTPAPLAASPLPRRAALFMADAVPDVADALRRAAQWLAEAGYQVEEASPPDFAEIAQVWIDICGYSANPSRPYGKAIQQHSDERTKNAVKGKIAHSRPMNDAQFIDAMAQRTTYIGAWNAFLDRYPVMLMPVSNELPFDDQRDQRGDDEFGRILKAQSPLVTVATLGLPGLTVPTGMAGDRPVGVQLVSQRFRESLLLDVGEIIETRAERDTGPVEPLP